MGAFEKTCTASNGDCAWSLMQQLVRYGRFASNGADKRQLPKAIAGMKRKLGDIDRTRLPQLKI
jgi:hypothetical protein